MLRATRAWYVESCYITKIKLIQYHVTKAIDSIFYGFTSITNPCRMLGEHKKSLSSTSQRLALFHLNSKIILTSLTCWTLQHDLQYRPTRKVAVLFHQYKAERPHHLTRPHNLGSLIPSFSRDENSGLSLHKSLLHRTMPPREDKLLLLLGTLLTDTLCSKEKEKLQYRSKIT